MSDVTLVCTKRRMPLQKLKNPDLDSILFGLGTRDGDGIVIIIGNVL